MEEVIVSETIAAPPGPFADAVVASAEVDASRIEVLFESEEYLRTPMNDADVVLKAAELAAEHAAIETLDAELAQATAAFKAEKERITDERDGKISNGNHLARLIRDREHETLVKIRDEKVFATGVIRTVRIDTGAIVRERVMEADERQADLFPPASGDEDETPPADSPESFSALSNDSDAPTTDDNGVAFDPDIIKCAACGEPGCKREKIQIDDGSFAHDDNPADPPKKRRGRK